MQKLKEHFGIRIDKDVREYTPADKDYLIDLIYQHKVLYFANQTLTFDELSALSEILGSIWTNQPGGLLYGNGEGKASHSDTNKITRVSNHGGVLGDYEVDWHCDISHKPWNSKGGTMPFRFLYCVKTADDETSVTSWFDQCWLYNNIPEDLRAYVETLEANFKAPYKTWWYDNTIPFVLADPIDGKKAVSLQKMFFRHFKGLGKVESDAIVDQLLKIALAEENVYRHEWAVGDLILSNNYNTAHKREAMLTKQERTLWRTTFQIPELIPHEIKPRAF